jgi:lipopolysaccharide/colanic/teichoic acid biosynthesis glycosyltransferase
MKRAMDIVFATAGLIAAAPLMALIALAIYRCDRRPVLFSQTRVGQFGRQFRLYKFRTMIADAEKLGIPLTAGNDRRITGIGRWLRRSKLDELPQLWNVVKGDMSLVGPRPEVPRYVALYTADQRRVLDVRPGITDPASLDAFDEGEVLANSVDPEQTYCQTLMPRKLRTNLEYIRSRSVLTDLAVIVKTIRRVLFNSRLTFGRWS